MKNPHVKLPGAKPRVAFALLLGAAVAASGQSFSLDWATLDGGGGTSTGGVYAVTGTIGQPDAGAAMSSGTYSLTGGFWSLIAAVQTVRRASGQGGGSHCGKSWNCRTLRFRRRKGLLPISRKRARRRNARVASAISNLAKGGVSLQDAKRAIRGKPK